ncbi:MAG: DUF1015 domain-containing protein [Rhodothermia bacterium]
MAILHPFKAHRPRPEFVSEVACVPYDVVSAAEARELGRGRPNSFLRVIRPEIDLAPETDEHADEVYERGAENLHEFLNGPLFIEEDAPSLYLYRLTMDGRLQTGIFGCVSVADYDADVILKHEKTRLDKEDDRTRHILTQHAHAEPIMLTFRSNQKVRAGMDEATSAEPLYDFTADDGVRHQLWRVADAGLFVDALAEVPSLYVADGHHRCKAASRTAEVVRGSRNGSQNAESEFFPAVLFPIDQMQILAYNRVIYSLPGGVDAFERRLRDLFQLEETTEPVPSHRGHIRIYLGGRWLAMTLPDTASDSAAARLDIARLGEFILEPLLAITDPRTDSNIGFVGGIRGTEELERLVSNGSAEMAISMHPTSIEELVDVSNAGLLMPPKSTWFEPKLRSGLLVHLFD